MPTPYHSALRTLRMKYKSASAAHQSCTHALDEAKRRGEPPSPDLIEQVANALRAVNAAREELFAAIGREPAI